MIDDEIELLINQQRQAISDLNENVADLDKRLMISIKENLEASESNRELEEKLMKVIKTNLATSSTNKELERKLLEALSLTKITKKPGSTANDKAIDDNSMNIKSSTFNPFGPTSIKGPTNRRAVSVTGPTNRRATGPTSRNR